MAHIQIVEDSDFEQKFLMQTQNFHKTFPLHLVPTVIDQLNLQFQQVPRDQQQSTIKQSVTSSNHSQPFI